MKKDKRIFFIVGGLFILLILSMMYSPKPVDWRMSFDPGARDPYGCYVFDHMIRESLSGEVAPMKKGLLRSPQIRLSSQQNLIIITDNFKPGESYIDSLIRFAQRGNDILISAFDFSPELLDTLDIDLYSNTVDTSINLKGKEILNFYNPQLNKQEGYFFPDKIIIRSGFSIDGTENIKLLGYGSNEKVNFISAEYGKGKILLHLQPLALTNYHMLKGDPEYAMGILAFLKNRKTIIDHYHKPYRVVNNSPTSYILSQTPLRMSYYLLILALLIYLVLGSRRKQKAIAVVTPPQNKSAEFIRTLGKLYYKTRNHAGIAQKKSIYFREFLKERYNLGELNMEPPTIEKIVAKTGVREALVKKVIRKVLYFTEKEEIDEGTLMDYHKDLEEFYNQCI